MNHLIRILVGSLCAALVAGACTKNDSAEQDQQVPMVFHALSQAADVKVGEGTNAFPYDNFGIWGIARKSGESDYVLWEAAALTQVDKVTVGSTTAYKPATDAYWVSGYTYHFIGLAPFTADGKAASTPIIGTDRPIEPTFSTSSGDAMTFSYDLSGNYTAGKYTFDLMAAVAEATVTGSASSHTSSQRLTFWHLFSKININVAFKDGANTFTGTVDKVRLQMDKDVAYTISFNADKQLNVATDAGTKNQAEVIFAKSESTNAIPASLHIVPQACENMRLFLDYTIGSGENSFSLKDIEVNLSAAGNPDKYGYNESYNWNIIIGPKEDISFNVTVAPWIEQQVGNDIVIP